MTSTTRCLQAARWATVTPALNPSLYFSGGFRCLTLPADFRLPLLIKILRQRDDAILCNFLRLTGSAMRIIALVLTLILHLGVVTLAHRHCFQ